MIFTVFSLLYTETRTAKVVVLGLRGGRALMGHVYEAYLMYKRLNPHPRFVFIEQTVNSNMDDRELENLVRGLKKKGVDFIIAPHVSSFTNRLAEVAERYDMVVFAPLSMFLEPRFNLIKMSPDFDDMAELVLRHLTEEGMKRVYVLSRSGEILKNLITNMERNLKDVLERAGIDAEDFRRDFKRDGPVIVITLFPDDVSEDMIDIVELLEEGQEVILFTSNFGEFRRFYDGRLKGLKYISAKFYSENVNFVNLYEKMFGREILPSVAAAYDTFALIDEIMKRQLDMDARSIRGMGMFHGIQGDIPLNVDADMSHLLEIDEF